MASNSTPSPSPSEPAPESVGRRVSRRLEAVKRVLKSDVADVRKTIKELLKKEEVIDEPVSDVPETPVLLKPTDKAPGLMDVQASQRIETGRTPRLARNLLALDAGKQDDKSLSEGFTEVFRRMSELVFVSNTNPIFAFMSEMFLHIRVRSDHVQQEKTFDQIFEEQISWYCEQHFLARRRVFSPALAFHWEHYFQSAGAERYEDNLTGHSDPEIQLYGILMRSCLRMFDQYMKRIFPEGPASRPPSPAPGVLMADAETVEGSRLRDHAMTVHSQRLLLDQALSDYFEENLPRHLKAGLDEALPPGVDGLYLFDTHLFVSALIEKAEKGGRAKGSLGSVLNAQALEEACGKMTGVPGFFTFPSHEGHPERFSPRDIACKNLVLWKRIGDHLFYESLVRGETPEEPRDFDREVDFMGKADVKYLAHRVVDALKDSSNIYEVFFKLFPDLQPTVFAAGLATGFFSERLKKLAAVTKMLLHDETELMETASRLFGILSKGNLAVWNTPFDSLKNRTPFQYMKQKAVGIAESLRAAGVDRATEETAYESQWRFLNQSPEQAWSARSPSHASRIKRLSGWRTVQRNVRLKMIADLLQQMGWNFREHVLDEQDRDWWMTLDRQQSDDGTRRQLSLPFLTTQGRLLVCRFPELQR